MQEILLKSVDCKPSRYLHRYYILRIYKSGTYVFLAASGTTTNSAETERASIDESVAIPAATAIRLCFQISTILDGKWCWGSRYSRTTPCTLHSSSRDFSRLNVAPLRRPRLPRAPLNPFTQHQSVLRPLVQETNRKNPTSVTQQLWSSSLQNHSK